MIGIGINRRSEIPGNELGLAGSFPRGLIIHLAGPPKFGIGINRRIETQDVAGRRLPSATMPTDPPAARVPARDRAEGADRVGAGEALTAGMSGRPTGIDLGDLVRGLGHLLEQVGQITRAPLLGAGGQLLGRIVGPAASPTATPSTEELEQVYALDAAGAAQSAIAEARFADRGEQSQPTRDQAGYDTRGLAVENRGGQITGRVDTAQGSKTFEVEAPYAHEGFATSGGGVNVDGSSADNAAT